MNTVFIILYHIITRNNVNVKKHYNLPNIFYKMYFLRCHVKIYTDANISAILIFLGNPKLSNVRPVWI